MRRLVLKMSMSLDGFVCGPNGELDWIFRSFDDELTAWQVEALRQAGVHAMGSRTFRDMANHWPTSPEPYAAPMNEIPKVVFSKQGSVDPKNITNTTRALDDARRAGAERGLKPVAPSPHARTWSEARVMTGDLSESVTRLKQEAGKDIVVYGGAELARSLVKTGLVDEYQLLIHPTVLGRGRAIFSDIERPADLKLARSKVFGTGAAELTYSSR
jgi:dihydrofolate reductase